jgi:ureidoacrylate peracid hydrolase
MEKKELAFLSAEPEPLEIDLSRLAVLVIDVQNAFVSKGGMYDIWGALTPAVSNVVRPIKTIVEAARLKGVRVIYVAHILYPDAREVGPNCPFWHKRVLKSYRERPEMRDSLHLRGAWGSHIVDELKPREDEILIEKRRFSAFVGTGLDNVLRSYEIKYLLFTGVATNICIESSLRDACHLEYFPILASDASAACPDSRQESTVANVIQAFGWAAKTKSILGILK